MYLVDFGCRFFKHMFFGFRLTQQENDLSIHTHKTPQMKNLCNCRWSTCVVLSFAKERNKTQKEVDLRRPQAKHLIWIVHLHQIWNRAILFQWRRLKFIHFCLFSTQNEDYKIQVERNRMSEWPMWIDSKGAINAVLTFQREQVWLISISMRLAVFWDAWVGVEMFNYRWKQATDSNRRTGKVQSKIAVFSVFPEIEKCISDETGNTAFVIQVRKMKANKDKVIPRVALECFSCLFWLWSKQAAVNKLPCSWWCTTGISPTSDSKWRLRKNKNNRKVSTVRLYVCVCVCSTISHNRLEAFIRKTK